MIKNSVVSFLTKERFSGYFLGFLISLLVCYVGISKPWYNWDMIGYTAATLHQEGLRDEALREQTYKEVQRSVSKEKFQELNSGHYRATVYKSHKALTQQIPFYSIRIIFISLLRVAKNVFGLSIIDASYIISSFFAGALAFLIFYLISPKSYLDIIFYCSMLYLSGIKDIPGLSTPDSMAAFVTVLIILSFIRQFKILPFLILLLPAVRTDFVIISMLFSMLIVLKGQKNIGISTGLGALLIYFLINKTHGNYGYLTIFNFTFNGFDPYPAEMKLTHNLQSYLVIYLQGAKGFITNKHSLIYLVYACVWLRSKPKLQVEGNEVVFVIMSFVLIHLALFPAYFERYFFWCALISLSHSYVILTRKNSTSMLAQTIKG